MTEPCFRPAPPWTVCNWLPLDRGDQTLRRLTVRQHDPDRSARRIEDAAAPLESLHDLVPTERIVTAVLSAQGS
jgi:hypothetical protein